MYNIDPKIWGKHWWNIVHFTTISYPEVPSFNDKKNFENLIYAMGATLPCENCRVHFKKNIIELPLTQEILNSRYELIKWGISLHNLVNKQTNKSEMQLDDAIKIYTNGKTTLLFNPNILNIIVLLIVVLIILFLYK